jgi:hypothetical protein
MMENPLIPIQDDDSYQFRLNEDKCTTCLFHPGRMQNGMREVIDDARARGSYVQCHETYEWGDFTPAAGVKTAMCRGYWDAYRDEQYGLTLLADSNAMVEVPTPPEPDDVRPHRLHGSAYDGTFTIRPVEES